MPTVVFLGRHNGRIHLFLPKIQRLFLSTLLKCSKIYCMPFANTVKIETNTRVITSWILIYFNMFFDKNPAHNVIF